MNQPGCLPKECKYLYITYVSQTHAEIDAEVSLVLQVETQLLLPLLPVPQVEVQVPLLLLQVQVVLFTFAYGTPSSMLGQSVIDNSIASAECISAAQLLHVLETY